MDVDAQIWKIKIYIWTFTEFLSKTIHDRIFTFKRNIL